MDNEQNEPTETKTSESQDDYLLRMREQCACGPSVMCEGCAACCAIDPELDCLQRLALGDEDEDRELIEPCGVERVHERHPRMDNRAQGGRLITCPGVDPSDEPADDLGSYVAMFATYCHEQRVWLGAAQQPLVFHMRKLCQKLDANPDAPASLSSAYLQAFRRLDLQRPGNTQPAGAAGDLPGQGSIFDELD